MKTLGYYNGVIDELENCRVPMLDRGFYFGDGVFTVFYCRNHIPYELGIHIDELFHSAEGVRIQPCVSKEELSQLLPDLIRKVEDGTLWVYVQLTRGTEIRNHAFPAGSVPSNLTVMIRPAKLKDVHGKVRCVTTEDRRHTLCNFKTLNYIANVLAAQEALDADADECIFRRGETVTECVHANLAILKNGVLLTHPANELIYAGIGRRLMLCACESLGIPYLEKAFTVREMLEADEVFRVSGSSMCMQIVEIDGTPVGGKDEKRLCALQNFLLNRFLTATGGKNEK